MLGALSMNQKDKNPRQQPQMCRPCHPFDLREPGGSSSKCCDLRYSGAWSWFRHCGLPALWRENRMCVSLFSVVVGENVKVIVPTCGKPHWTACPDNLILSVMWEYFIQCSSLHWCLCKLNIGLSDLSDPHISSSVFPLFPSNTESECCL